MQILPSGKKGRIRGLQTHKKKEDIAQPGSRTAVNISGLAVEEITRGEVVVTPNHYLATRRIDAFFRHLPDASTPLKHGTEVKFFAGTAETIATLRLLGAESLNPGEKGWIQLELREPVVVVRGDRYILRRPSPSETLGGGIVLDPHPKTRHKRFNELVLKRFESMLAGSPADLLIQASLSLGPASIKDVVARLNWMPMLPLKRLMNWPPKNASFYLKAATCHPAVILLSWPLQPGISRSKIEELLRQVSHSNFPCGEACLGKN